MTTTSTLSGRDRAILRAVAAGGAELQLGSEPELFFDGRSCCDQSAAHYLVRAGLIAAATLGLGRLFEVWRSFRTRRAILEQADELLMDPKAKAKKVDQPAQPDTFQV